jgi:hypothetical protein
MKFILRDTRTPELSVGRLIQSAFHIYIYIYINMYSFCLEKEKHKCHYCNIKIHENIRTISLYKKELFFHNECFLIFREKIKNEYN